MDYELHYFEQLRPWEVFASSSFVVLATLGIMLNVCALVVVMKNGNISTIIRSFLLTDHLFRIIADLILYYPAMCAFVRVADVGPELYGSYYWYDLPEFVASNRTYTPICVAYHWVSILGSDMNQVLALTFNAIMHFLELLQFAISINRWLAVAFGGQYHHLIGDMNYLVIEVMLTAAWLPFYKYSFGNKMYFDAFSFSLISNEYQGYMDFPNSLVLMAVRIVAVVVTLLSIMLDCATFVLLRRHLERSRQLTQSNEKTGADIRLVKQLLINHLYSIFVATCNCYMLIVFSPLKQYGYAEGVKLMKTSWFIFMATAFFPGLGNVVNGAMTMIFLSRRRAKTIVTATATKTFSPPTRPRLFHVSRRGKDRI